MQTRLLNDAALRTFAVVLDTDDEVVDCLQRFASENGLTAASFTGLGALRQVVVGYFDWQAKDYSRIEIAEQVEVLALTGNIALDGEKPKLHPHIVVGKRDGSAHGGHLLAGYVRPTLELVVTETPVHLRRHSDAETGLALLRL